MLSSGPRDSYYYTQSVSYKGYSISDSVRACTVNGTAEYCQEYYTYLAYCAAPDGTSATPIFDEIPNFYIYTWNGTNYDYYQTPDIENEFKSYNDLTNFLSQEILQHNQDYYDVYPNIAYAMNSLSYDEAQVTYTMLSPIYPDDDGYISYTYSIPESYYYTFIYENMFANAFLSEVSGKSVVAAPTSVPFYSSYVDTTFSLQGLMGFIFVTPALSLLLPVYVFSIVVEKSNKSLELNKLMKLNMVYYWIANFLTGYLLYLFPLIFVILIGFFFQIGFIAQSWSVSIPLFLFWGFAQLSLAFFLSTLFSKERIATLISYAIVFGSVIIAIVINLFIFKNGAAVWWYMLWPSWAFVRGFYLIQIRFANQYFPPLSLFTAGFEYYSVLLYLFFESIFFFILAVYLEMVIPREWGISKPVYFPISNLILFFKKLVKNRNKASDLNDDYASQISHFEQINTSSDHPMNNEEKSQIDSVDLEKQRVIANILNDEKYLLKCVNISKKFGEKKALNDIFLAIENGECFGLLGPNGAGKTTLISILSGIIKPTSGYAIIAGKKTGTSDLSYRDEIGICPQFDVLWDDLTVREHLNYYHLLHGLEGSKKLHVSVNELADRVCLSDHLDKRVRELSGGMKRKLSIAISLVGDPKLLLLDEPTTGLDPDARREVWDLLSDARVGRSTIITTHNMEEADVLSTRIGIVTKGRLSCVGNQQFLKSRYGKGYNLTITSSSPQSSQSIIQFIQSMYPSSVLDSNYSNVLTFIIPTEEINISDLFTIMRNRKIDLGIKEWGLNQSSLEEVFLKLVRDDEDTSPSA